MTIQEAIQKIDRNLRNECAETLVVDAQNITDLEKIATHYQVAENTFLCPSLNRMLCKLDAFPSFENLLHLLSTENKNFFIREYSTFSLLKGDTVCIQMLQEILSFQPAGHAVLLTYRCKTYLQELMARNKKWANRICILDGQTMPLPKILLLDPATSGGEPLHQMDGIHNLANAIESLETETLYVQTQKGKRDFAHSLFNVIDLKHPYDMLCILDPQTALLPQEIGTLEEWRTAYTALQTYRTWAAWIRAKIGDPHHLDLAITAYDTHENVSHWLWLFFIALKLYGAKENEYLQTAITNADTPKVFIQNLYRSLLALSPHDNTFATLYAQRKDILHGLPNTTDTLLAYCKIVPSKEKEALYYLTDNTPQEKELIFYLLYRYGMQYEKEEIMKILQLVYPDLYAYLKPYRFGNVLLDTYFESYTYQKVLNQVFPEFLQKVEEEALTRDYNTLPPRSSRIESIDPTDAQTYFVDAMGVEYLSFLMSQCHRLNLLAKVTICRSELPSITSCNKEFWDVLSTPTHPIIPIVQLDKIKHHGDEGFDYSHADKKLPTHLIRELEILSSLMQKIKIDLESGKYTKAILISDHGASRLAVIHENETFWKMKTDGIHSGRCCPKEDLFSEQSESSDRPDCAADADGFWVLANYDRFKGSRKANVEVHGGATLEEVVVPILEITTLPPEIEVKLLPLDAPVSFTGTPKITISFRKKAAIKLYITQNLPDVHIEIDGHSYAAESIGDNFYLVQEMPEIRRTKKYAVSVYTCGNQIAKDLPLLVQKESGSEKSIL